MGYFWAFFAGSFGNSPYFNMDLPFTEEPD